MSDRFTVLPPDKKPQTHFYCIVCGTSSFSVICSKCQLMIDTIGTDIERADLVVHFIRDKIVL